MLPHSTEISACHQHLFHQHLVADTQGQLPISACDRWTGGTGGRGDELQSGVSSGTVINGLLPETSATQLSIIGRAQKLSEGMMGSAVRSWAGGGHHAAPSEVFITVFCHYMIKVIVGRAAALWQVQYSPPVINQWFPLMIRTRADGFLCKCAGYTVQAGLSDLCAAWKLLPGKANASIKLKCITAPDKNLI